MLQKEVVVVARSDGDSPFYASIHRSEIGREISLLLVDQSLLEEPLVVVDLREVLDARVRGDADDGGLLPLGHVEGLGELDGRVHVDARAAAAEDALLLRELAAHGEV